MNKLRAYQRVWVKARREAWFKDNGPCVDCGSWERLELDHKNPADKVTHAVWSWAEKRRLAELAKCVARCHKCHKRKSAGEKALGEANGQSVLTEDLVRAMRRDRRDGMTLRAIMAKYDARHSTVYRVITRQTWRHVADLDDLELGT